MRLSGTSWLLFLNAVTSLDDIFSDVNIPFNSEFLVVQGSREDKETLSVTEVYRVAGHLPLQKVVWGSWSPKHRLSGPERSLNIRRDNLQGLVLRAATVHVGLHDCNSVKNTFMPRYWTPFDVNSKCVQSFSSNLYLL